MKIDFDQFFNKKSQKVLMILFAGLSSDLLWAGQNSAGHSAHVSDLIYPFINSLIFFVGLFMMTKESVRTHFKNLHLQIKTSIQDSQNKIKEAEKFLKQGLDSQSQLDAQISEQSAKFRIERDNILKELKDEHQLELKHARQAAILAEELLVKKIKEDLIQREKEFLVREVQSLYRASPDLQNQFNQKSLQQLLASKAS
jgi:hypothetical protein